MRDLDFPLIFLIYDMNEVKKKIENLISSVVNKRIESFLDFLDKKISYEDLDDFTKKVYEIFKSKLNENDPEYYESTIPKLFNTFYGGCLEVCFIEDILVINKFDCVLDYDFKSIKDAYKLVCKKDLSLRNIYQKFYKHWAEETETVDVFIEYFDHGISFDEFKKNLEDPIKIV